MLEHWGLLMYLIWCFHFTCFSSKATQVGTVKVVLQIWYGVWQGNIEMPVHKFHIIASNSVIYCSRFRKIWQQKEVIRWCYLCWHHHFPQPRLNCVVLKEHKNSIASWFLLVGIWWSYPTCDLTSPASTSDEDLDWMIDGSASGQAFPHMYFTTYIKTKDLALWIWQEDWYIETI